MTNHPHSKPEQPAIPAEPTKQSPSPEYVEWLKKYRAREKEVGAVDKEEGGL